MNHLVINCERGAWAANEEDLRNTLKAYPEIRTLLFVYWKWKVPKDFLEKYRCIGFHTGPLLEGRGRGGSPIQNLKKLGVRITTLCAFEMNEKFDSGNIRLAVPISLEGDMKEIWKRIYEKLPEMVDYLTEVQPDIPRFFTRAMAV